MPSGVLPMQAGKFAIVVVVSVTQLSIRVFLVLWKDFNCDNLGLLCSL